jgi:streptomycin 6-kinase
VIPAEFVAHVERTFGPDGRDWVRSLPALVVELEERWSIAAGGAVGAGFTSVVLSAKTVPGDEPVALKLAFAGVENRHEIEALRLYDGDGAVQLIEADAQRGALLLEWLDAEWSLLGLDELEACRIACALARRLWKPVPTSSPFDRLEDEARRWAAELVDDNELHGRPVPARIVAEGVELLPWLVETSPPPVLLHRDLHHGNVLAGRREPWLVIDPKPITGDAAFDLAAMLRGRWGEGAAGMERRFHVLCHETGLEPRRVRGWALAKTIAWGIDPPHRWELDMAEAIAALPSS